MLEMKEACESCGCPIGTDQSAYICSYETTFCPRCVRGPVGRICPCCTSELVRRPMRKDGDGLKFQDIIKSGEFAKSIVNKKT